jgi:cytochrome c556
MPRLAHAVTLPTRLENAMRFLCLTLVFAAAVMTTVPDANQAASKPPGPISEQDYEAIMKKVGPAFAAMSKNLDGGEVDRAAKDAQQLSELFTEAEKFWAQHKREDGVKFAQAARKQADEVVSGVTAARGYLKSDARVQTGVQARLSRARTSVSTLKTICERCHTAYREGDATAGFRIKPSALVP